MMETAAPGLHDAILLCAVVAAVYMVVALLQLMQLKRTNPKPIAVREPSLGRLAGIGGMPATDVTFSQQLKRSQVEVDVRRLDVEVHRLNDLLQEARGQIRELRNQREQREAQKPAVESVKPNVTPFYTDAMGLAKRGMTASSIAARCGISLREAELVAALASKDQGKAAPSEITYFVTPNHSDARRADYRHRVAA